MNKTQIENNILELKLDYTRLQNDLEKLESVNGNTSPLEKQLNEIENELKKLRNQLSAI